MLVNFLVQLCASGYKAGRSSSVVLYGEQQGGPWTDHVAFLDPPPD